MRDQITVMLKCLTKYAQEDTDKALDMCLEKSLFSANDFKSILSSGAVIKENNNEVGIKSLGTPETKLMVNIKPNKSTIDVYQNLFKISDMTPDKLTTIRGYAKRLRLSGLTINAQDILLKAQKESPSYDDFLTLVLESEVKAREEKQRLLRLKAAKLPLAHNLDMYDHSISNGLSATQLNQLRELHWVEESFNLMLTGPCGVGKTFIASGLCADAIDKGYKAYFRNMDELLTTLKLKNIVASAK